jgi:hypothetical protein
MKVVVGCLVALGAACVLCCGGGILFLAMAPEGGVRVGGEIEEYATEYLQENNVLSDGEQVMAYYDVTLMLDGTEAAILTDQRVIYHRNGKDTAISLDQIADVRHRYESLIGDVIEVDSEDGTMIKIEIAPMNAGESFLNALQNQLRNAPQDATATDALPDP